MLYNVFFLFSFKFNHRNFQDRKGKSETDRRRSTNIEKERKYTFPLTGKCMENWIFCSSRLCTFERTKDVNVQETGCGKIEGNTKKYSAFHRIKDFLNLPSPEKVLNLSFAKTRNSSISRTWCLNKEFTNFLYPSFSIYVSLSLFSHIYLYQCNISVASQHKSLTVSVQAPI